MKKYIIVFALIASLISLNPVHAQISGGSGGGIGSPTYWKLVGTVLQPVVSTWSVLMGAFFTGNSNTATSTPIAKGDLVVAASSTAWTNLAVGTNGKVLTSSSTAPTGLSWETPASTGITSLNGSTSSTQTFATASSSDTYSISTSNGVHTLTIPNNIGWFTNDSGFIYLTSLSSTATGLDYSTSTGEFSWSSGYEGLRTASSTVWNAKQDALGYTPLNPANNLSDVNSSSTARTNLGVDLTKSNNYKSIQWSYAIASSSASYDDPIFTFKSTSTIDSVYVSSRDSSNTVDFQFVYSTDPTASTSTSFALFSSTQTATSTPSSARLLTPSASSTPNAGDTLRIYTAPYASSSITTFTIWYYEN